MSRDEELFLRHWVYDEAHYLSGVGPAKRLQVERRVSPADLATLVAAALPDPAEQEAATGCRPAGGAVWPWDDAAFRARVDEARAVLATRW